jgi:uncharacterized protein (DUF2344 family)
MDVMLKDYTEAEGLFARLQERVPPGLHVFDVEEMPLRGESLMSLVEGFSYSLSTTGAPEDLAERVAELMARDEILVERKVKQKKPKKGRGWKPRGKTTAEMNLRPLIESIEVKRQDGANATLIFTTRDAAGRLAKPKEILALLGLPPDQTQAVKEATLLKEEHVRVLA